jgi:transposase
MLFKWRRRYRAEQLAGSTELVRVTVVGEAPGTILPTASVEQGQEIVKPAASVGTIEVRTGQAVVKVDGVVDAETLRTVLKSVRS